MYDVYVCVYMYTYTCTYTCTYTYQLPQRAEAVGRRPRCAAVAAMLLEPPQMFIVFHVIIVRVMLAYGHLICLNSCVCYFAGASRVVVVIL